MGKTISNKARFELEALEQRVLLSGDLLQAGAVLTQAGSQEDLGVSILAAEEHSIFDESQSATSDSDSNSLSDLFAGLGQEPLLPPAISGEATADAENMEVAAVTESAVVEGQGTTAPAPFNASAAEHTESPSQVVDATSGVLIFQLVETLRAANGPPETGPDSQPVIMATVAGGVVDLTSSADDATNVVINVHPDGAIDISGSAGDDTASPISGIIDIKGNARGTLELVGPAVDVTWYLASANSGCLILADGTTITFSNIDLITGGSGHDTLVGPDSANVWTLAGSREGSLNGALAFSSIEEIRGGGGVDRLIGPASANTWALSGNCTGLLNGTLAFSQMENLLGGALDDDFVFATDASFAGTLDGGKGTGRLDYSAYTSEVVVDLQAGQATGTAGIRNIQNVWGGAANDLLGGDAGDNALDGMAGNDVLIGRGGADTLLGGSEEDVLIGDQGNLSSDSLPLLGSWTSAASPANCWIEYSVDLVNWHFLATVSATSGATASYMVPSRGSLTGFYRVIPVAEAPEPVRMGIGVLADGSVRLSWIAPSSLPVTRGGQGNNAGVEVLDGGAGRDLILGDNATLAFHRGSGDALTPGYRGILQDADSPAWADWTIALDSSVDDGSCVVDDTITGGGDEDELFGQWGNDVFVAESWEPGLSGSQGNDWLAGGPGDDTLKGPANDATWIISGENAGTVEGLSFTGIENLQGAADNADTFVMASTGHLSGVIDGGGGGFDSLVIQGGPYNSVTFTPRDGDSGSVDVDGNVIEYDGLEPIVTPSAGNVEFNGTTGDDTIRVTSSGGQITISGAGETTSFAIPTVSLTINGGAGADTVTLASDLLLPGANLTVLAETITVSGGVTVSTRQVAPGGDLETALSTGPSGNIVLTGISVTVSRSAKLLAQDNSPGMSAVAIAWNATSGQWQPDKSYQGVEMTSTSGAGSGMTVDITVDAAGSPTVTLVNPGRDHAVGDTVVFRESPDSKDVTVTVTVTQLVGNIRVEARDDSAGMSLEVGYKNAEPTLDVNGSTIKGENVTLVAIASTDISDPGTNDGFLSWMSDPLSDFNLDGISAFLGFAYSKAKASVTIGRAPDGTATRLGAEGNLTIRAHAASRAAMVSLGTRFDSAVTYSNATAWASLAEGAEVTVGGTVSVESDVSNTSNLTAYLISSQEALGIGVVIHLTDAHAYIGSGAVVQAQNVSVTTTVANDLSNTVTPFELAGGESAGITIGVSVLSSTAEAYVNDTITVPGDITVSASTETSNQNTSVAEPKGALSSVTAPVIGWFTSKKLDDRSGAKFELSAAIAVAVAHNTSTAYIGPSSVLRSEGNINVNASVVDRLKMSATSQAEDARTGISAAVSVGDTFNTADAYIAGGADVAAKNGVSVYAETIVPSPFPDTAWGLVGVDDTDSGLASGWAIFLVFASSLEIPVTNMLTTYVHSAATKDASGETNDEKSSLEIAGSLSFLFITNHAHAYIDAGAKVNQGLPNDSPYRSPDQTVSVSALNKVTTINVGGIFSFPNPADIKKTDGKWDFSALNPLGSSGGNAFGGTYDQVEYHTSAIAEINAGARVHADKLVQVSANSTNRNWTITLAGGQAQKTGVEGAFALLVENASSIAQVHDGATVTSKALEVTATTDSRIYNIVGGVVYSKSVGAGFSIGVTTVTRTTLALIGHQLSQTPGASTINIDGDITLKANSTGHVQSYSLASAVTNVGLSPLPGTEGEDPLDGVSLPLLYGDIGSQGKTSFGVAGDVSVNVVTDSSKAFINDGGLVQAASNGKISLTATNTTAVIAVAGAAAIAVGTDSTRSLGIAGSFAINIILGSTEAYVEHAILPVAGGLALEARRTGRLLGITAGGSGAPRKQGIAIAGSVSVNEIRHTTATRLTGMTGTVNGDITLTTTDDSNMVVIAGSLAYGGKAGVGAAIAYSLIKNTVSATVTSSAGLKHTGKLALLAKTENDIVSVSGSVGLSQSIGAAGTLSINSIADTVEAKIVDSSNTTDSGGPVSIKATDNAYIFAFAGGFAIGKTFGLGTAFAFDDIKDIVNAGIRNSTITTSGTLDITAEAVATITNVSVGAAGSKNVAVGGSLCWNDIVNTIDAYIAGGSTVNASGTIAITASEIPTINTGSGGLAGAQNVAIGLAGVNNDIESSVKAYIEKSTVQSSGGSITIEARGTAKIWALSIEGGVVVGGSGLALNGAWITNEIRNTIEAHIGGCPSIKTLAAGGDISATATDTATIEATSIGFSVALAGDVNVSISLIKADNTIANKVRSWIEDSIVDSAGAVTVKSTSTPHIESWVVAASISVSKEGAVGVGGAWATNTTENDIEAFIRDTVAVPATTITAVGTVTVEARAETTVDGADKDTSISHVGYVGVGGSGAVGASIGASLSYDTVRNDVAAYILGATVTSSGGGVTVLADSKQKADTNVLATSVGVGTGGGGVALAGGFSYATVQGKVKAYIGRGTVVSAPGDVQVTANSIRHAEAGVLGLTGAGGANFGGALGYTEADAIVGDRNGSVPGNDADRDTVAYLQGKITRAANLTIQARDASTADAECWALSAGVGYIAVGLSGANGDAYVMTTVAAFVDDAEVGTEPSKTSSVGDVVVRAEAETSADADAIAVALALGWGGAAAGSWADAKVEPKLTAYIGGGSLVSVSGSVSLESLHNYKHDALDPKKLVKAVNESNPIESNANAVAPSGGLIALAGGWADATGDPTLDTFVEFGTTVRAAKDVSVLSLSFSRAYANATTLAIGVGYADARSDARANGEIKSHLDGTIKGQNIHNVAAGRHEASTDAFSLGLLVGVVSKAQVSPTLSANVGSGADIEATGDIFNLSILDEAPYSEKTAAGIPVVNDPGAEAKPALSVIIGQNAKVKGAKNEVNIRVDAQIVRETVTLAELVHPNTVQVEAGSINALTLTVPEALEMTATFALSSIGADNDKFVLDPQSGQLDFKSPATLDGDANGDGIYKVHVTGTFSNGQPIAMSIEVQVVPSATPASLAASAQGFVTAFGPEVRQNVLTVSPLGVRYVRFVSNSEEKQQAEPAPFITVTATAAPTIVIDVGAGTELTAGSDEDVVFLVESNHQATAIGGGLDGIPAPLAVVIAEATVGGTIDVYLRGNIQHGGSLTLELHTANQAIAIGEAMAVGPIGGTGVKAVAKVNPVISTYVTPGSHITVGGNFSIRTLSEGSATAEARGIAGAIGFAVGVSLAEAVVTPTVRTYIGTGASITAGGSITVETLHNYDADGQKLDRKASATAEASAGALTGVGAGTGASATAEASPNVSAYVDTGATLSAGTGSAITLRALANNVADANARGISVTGLGALAVGATLADATANGSTKAYLDGNVLQGGDLIIEAQSTHNATAESTAVAGGGILSGAGSKATATASPTLAAYIATGRTVNVSDDVAVTAFGQVNASADALGVSVAKGLAIGVSLAEAVIEPQVNAYIGRDAAVTAGGDITLQALHNIAPDGSLLDQGAEARASTPGGGLLAGIGADAKATAAANAASYTDAGAVLSAGGNITLASFASNHASAHADGLAIGGVGIGTCLANAVAGDKDNGKGLTKAYISGPNQAGQGSLDAGGVLVIFAVAVNAADASADAAAGGIISGNGADATARVSPWVHAYVGNQAIVRATGDVVINAVCLGSSHADAQGVSVGGLAVGSSKSQATVTATVAAEIRDSASVSGHDILLQSSFNVPQQSYPVTNAAQATSNASAIGAGSGSATSSTVTSNTTVMTVVGAGARLNASNDAVLSSQGSNITAVRAVGEAGGLLTGGSTDGVSNAITNVTTTVGQGAQVEVGHDAVISSDADTWATIYVKGGAGQSLLDSLKNLFKGDFSNAIPSIGGLGFVTATVNLSNLAGTELGMSARVVAGHQASVTALAVARVAPPVDQTSVADMFAGGAFGASAVARADVTMDSDAIVHLAQGASVTASVVVVKADNQMDAAVVTRATAKAEGLPFAVAIVQLTVGSVADPSEARVSLDVGTAITGVESVTLEATNRQTTGNLLSHPIAKIDSTFLIGTANTVANGSLSARTTVEQAVESQIRAGSLTVHSESDYALERKPDSQADTVVTKVVKVIKTVTEFVQKKVCKWLPWPLNKLCNWVTQAVTKLVEVVETLVSKATELAFYGGTGATSTDRINLNGDISSVGTGQLYLGIHPDGTIDPASDVTAEVVGNDVLVGDIVNGKAPDLKFEAPKGEILGGAVLHLDKTISRIRVWNQSGKNLVFGRIEMTPVEQTEADVTYLAPKVTEYQQAVDDQEANQGTVDIWNVLDPSVNPGMANSDIRFTAPIGNQSGLTIIRNDRGSILADNADAVIMTRLVTLTANGGSVGTQSQPVLLSFWVDPSLSSGIQQVDGETGVYLEVTLRAVDTACADCGTSPPPSLPFIDLGNIAAGSGDVCIVVRDWQAVRISPVLVITLQDGTSVTGVLWDPAFDPFTAVNNTEDTIDLGFAHGWSDGEFVTYSSGSGTSIGGMGDQRSYRIHSVGSTTAAFDYTFDAAVALSGAQDLITFSYEHRLVTGDRLVYHANGNPGIGGLTDGQSYFVRVIDAHTIKLAASESGATALPYFIDPATSVDLALDRITFNVAHDVQTGQRMTYRNEGGADVGGLTDGTSYYASVVNDTTIRLALTQQDLDEGRFVDLTSAGTGLNHSLKVEAIDLDPTGTSGIQSLRLDLDSSAATGTSHVLDSGSIYLEVDGNLIRIVGTQVKGVVEKTEAAAVAINGVVRFGSLHSESGNISVSAGTTSWVKTCILLAGPVSSPVGTTRIETLGGNIVNLADAQLITARDIELLAAHGWIGTSARSLKVELTGGHLDASAALDIYLTGVSGALNVGQVTSNSGDIQLTVADSAATGEDLIVGQSHTVRALDGLVILRAGDDVEIAGWVSATASVLIEGDYGNADALGSSINITGHIAGTAITIRGNADNDSVVLDHLTSGTNTTVWTLAGSDEITVHMINGPITVNAGEGADTIVVGGMASTGSGSVNGGEGSDTLIGPDEDNTWMLSGNNAGTLNGGLEFQEVENLVGGSGNDTFVFADQAAVSGTLNGGGGVNQLDYSAYTSPVVVDPQTGTATGTGGIRNFNNLRGGSGNDVLGGDAGDNVLEGLGGDDILIGRGGADTLLGGSGNDVLVGDQSLLIVGNNPALASWATLRAPASYRAEYSVDLVHWQPLATVTATGSMASYVDSTPRGLMCFYRVIAEGGQGQRVPISLTPQADGSVRLDWESPAPAATTALSQTGGSAGDVIDGGEGSDLVFGDSVRIESKGDSTNPRFRVLRGAMIYDADGNALVTDTWRIAPGGTPSWGQYQITLLDGDDMVAAPELNGAADDYLAGGPGNDMIFGQAGDDVVQGDGSTNRALTGGARVGGYRDSDNLLHLNPSFTASSDGDDYIEGGAGNDVIFGNLGQDDLIGGNSNLFGLDTAEQRADGSDLIFGGAGMAICYNDTGAAHARDADVILGDNGNIFRLLGSGGTYLIFSYDNYGPVKIIPRAVQWLDYTPGGPDYNLAGALQDMGARDEIHGEAGDDVIYGQVGSDLLFGEGQDDDLIGGQGNDWISGGTGDDGVIGDDGRIFTSRNGTAEPLYGIGATVQTTVSTPGRMQQATINATNQLKKAVNLTPFNLDPYGLIGGVQDPLYRPLSADDILYGGLGNDFLHGGAGDDAISGAEALPAFYARPLNPGNVLGYGSPKAGEFAAYDEYHPLSKVPDFLLNFDAQASDGNDALFGDLGNDWLVGGTQNDNLYGGYGDDLLNLDDNLETSSGLNTAPDGDISTDRAYGGAGRDVLIANTTSDRLIDWVGQFNIYVVPFASNGAPTIHRALSAGLAEFLYALSASDGADPTRALDTGADAARRGEPEGELGLAVQKDPEWRAQTGAPLDVLPGNIPGGPRDVLASASFNDGQAQGFVPDTGIWSVSNGRFEVGPTALGGDAVSVYCINGYLPQYFEIRATINAAKPIAGSKANAYLIFDYQAPNDFKFVGVNISTNKIEMGHRDATGWHVDAAANAQVKPDIDYNLLLSVNGTMVTLVVDNQSLFTHVFTPRVDPDGFVRALNEGFVGLGADNAKARIDNVIVQVLRPDVTYDNTTGFDSLPMDLFGTPQSGQWELQNGSYLGSPDAGMDRAVDLANFRIGAAYRLDLTTDLATQGAGGFVFDAYGPDDFKFVTISSQTNQVLLGHHTARDGWVIDQALTRTILAGVTYTLGLTLQGNLVEVLLNGQKVLSHAYNALVSDGGFGLFSRDASTSFDSFRLQTNDPAAGISSPPLVGSYDS